jgi:hypothetical protein
MAICNRDLDVSQQQNPVQQCFGLVATGQVLPVALVDSPGTLKGVKVALTGLSGAPTVLLKVQRFIVGSGNTVISGGATTLTGQAVGTSGAQSLVLAAAGSSFLSLLAGDQITLTLGGSNTAADSMAVSTVIQYTQDIRSHYGV